MLSLEQIKRLEEKVFKAVELIKALKEENTIIRSKLEAADTKVEELEQIISDYRSNQVEIEEGIVKAIKQLEDMEADDLITTSADDKDSSPAENNSLFQKFNYSTLPEKMPAAEDDDDNEDEDETAVQSVPENQDKNSQLDIF